MQTSSDPYAFNPRGIASEAWTMARSNWKMFLGWASVPISISFIIELISMEAFLLRNTESVELFVYVIASNAMSFINVWLSAPYRLRVYRFVALGEPPTLFYGMQLWEERSWRLIWKTLVVNIQTFLLELVTVAIPCAIVMVVLRKNGIGMDSAVYQFVIYGCVASVGLYVAAYIFAQRIILTYPGAALDDKYTIAQYGVFGSLAKSSMAKAMVLIWAPAAVLGHLVGFGNYFIWDGNTLVMRLVGLLYNALLIYTGMASLAAGALIYKQLAPGFPVKDAEYVRIRKEIREIGKLKAQGVQEESRPASMASSQTNQPE